MLARYTDAIGVHVISQMAYDVGVPLRTVLASVCNAMRRNRFEILKAYAHFFDNTKLTKGHKFTGVSYSSRHAYSESHSLDCQRCTEKTSGLIFHGVPVKPFYGWCKPHQPKHRQLQNGSPIKKVVVACFAFTVDASLHNAWQLHKKGTITVLLTIWDLPDT